MSSLERDSVRDAPPALQEVGTLSLGIAACLASSALCLAMT